MRPGIRDLASMILTHCSLPLSTLVIIGFWIMDDFLAKRLPTLVLTMVDRTGCEGCYLTSADPRHERKK